MSVSPETRVLIEIHGPKWLGDLLATVIQHAERIVKEDGTPDVAAISLGLLFGNAERAAINGATVLVTPGADTPAYKDKRMRMLSECMASGVCAEMAGLLAQRRVDDGLPAIEASTAYENGMKMVALGVERPSKSSEPGK